MEAKQVELGITGHCAFALLGENMEEGVVELVNFEGNLHTIFGIHNAEKAAIEAFRRLKKRLRNENLTFYFGISFPQ